jgi:hypothetical protein
MAKNFVLARRPVRYPLGRGSRFRMASQIELYERLTDTRFDLRDVAAVTEPYIIKAEASMTPAAQGRTAELWAAIGNCLILQQ